MKTTKPTILSIFVTSIVSFMLGAILFSTNADSVISKENISSAEKIIGLEFTDAERDSMTGDLLDQLKNYENNRMVELPNSVAPSIQFNPIPVGATPPRYTILSTPAVAAALQKLSAAVTSRRW